jgi:precorrin isomerase
MIGARLTPLPATATVVVAADWRGVHLMRPETALRAHAMLTRVSPRIERSALLVRGNSSTEMLQFVRLVRESHHPSRRIFDAPAPMQGWLAELLTARESARLTAFMSRPSP